MSQPVEIKELDMSDEAGGKWRWIAPGIAALVTAILLIAGCSVGVRTYEEFRSAVDSGATCSQLWDIEQNFAGTADEERIVSDLRELGCHAAWSVRKYGQSE
jgi:hypothetical protein